jgi:hypothetical protein
LLPEFNGHAVWADEAAWIIENFTDIPVMVDVAGGWEHHVTTEELAALIAADVDVQWVRIAELVSYEASIPEEFPDEYVAGILEFCKDNDIKVYWCEWQVSAFDKVIEVIVGYEDIVTVGFKTNSAELEPAAGFKYVVDKGFAHVGATVESWYWETRHRGEWAHPEVRLWDPDNMPVSWMVCHAQEAVSAGVELIQFEPYWYFFGKTDGIAKDSLETLHYYLNSKMSSMETSAVILQTLMAEWLNGPAKGDIRWLDGRVESEWSTHPSIFNFIKMTEKYGVSSYSRGSLSSSQRVWLKVDVVVVEVLAKTLGTTLEKAILARENMRVEVERILYLYSKYGPGWISDDVAYRRKLPGVSDVVISQEPNEIEDHNFARVTIQVKCMVFPKKSWVS